jgi:hypothetical protein
MSWDRGLNIDGDTGLGYGTGYGYGNGLVYRLGYESGYAL